VVSDLSDPPKPKRKPRKTGKKPPEDSTPPHLKPMAATGLSDLARDNRQGPPTAWTQAIEDSIIDQLAEGVPLRAICRQPGMPNFLTVYNWMKRDPLFDKRIAHAREIGWESIGQECLEIAHDERHDWILTKRGPVVDETSIQRAKLQIETRLRLLAKWFPKRYGDKLEINPGEGFIPLTEMLAKAQAVREREALAFGEDVIEGEILSKELTESEKSAGEGEEQ
jgi:transposase